MRFCKFASLFLPPHLLVPIASGHLEQRVTTGGVAMALTLSATEFLGVGSATLKYAYMQDCYTPMSNKDVMLFLFISHPHLLKRMVRWG